MAEELDTTTPEYTVGQTVRLTLAIVGDDPIPAGTTGEIKEIAPDGTLRVQFGESLVGGIQPVDVGAA